MTATRDTDAPAFGRRRGSVGVALEIVRRGPAFSGVVFGEVGPYELIIGRIRGALDPLSPANAGVALIQAAPRSDAGLVEYWADLAILKPVDMAAGNGRLLYDVLNRGEQKALSAFCDAPRQTSLKGALEPGNGFLMRRGYTLAWSGWQGDIASGEGLMHCGLPVAAGREGPIVATAREEFIFDTPDDPLLGRLSYPAASLDQADARLTVRRHNRDPATALDSANWRYRSVDQIEISLPEGFDRGAIFDFVYRARDPRVMGMAFPAIRDAVSFLRNDAADMDGRANPLLAADGRLQIGHALAFGTSQSGRVLRDFLWQGFNADLDGRRVFDGVFIDGAGSRKSFVNFPFSQPGRFSRQHEDRGFPGDGFPFTYGLQRDPWSGDEDGVLRRAQVAGVTPKVIHTDSASEYWQGRAALVTTDIEGFDLVLPDDVRVYLYASVQHGGAAARPLPIFAYPTNPLSETPFNRSLLTALDAWVSSDTPPPPSRAPRIDDGALVPIQGREALGFPEIPGVGFPPEGNAFTAGRRWEPLIPRVDSDGNELPGLRLPALEAPVATYTGWNLRGAGYAPGELASVRGAVFPFPATIAQREATGDPRPSLQERYRDRPDYVNRVSAAARRLQAEGFLLAEDVDRLIEEASTAPELNALEAP